MPLIYKNIGVESDAWLAAHAFIMPGVSIGRGAVVGARAVVAQDIPKLTVVAGNPAKIIGSRPYTAVPSLDNK